MSRKIIDITGQRFGNLLVVKRCENNKSKGTCWICRCECGTKKIVLGNNLKRGQTKSCGCLRNKKTSARNTTHGLRNHALYSVWVRIKERCYNKNAKPYLDYGGRGIAMCDEWRDDFQMFYDWSIASGYKKGLSIDRIDNNGNYEPSNCRWATAKEQSRNRRSNKMIKYNGEVKSLSEWCELLELNFDTAKSRINLLGWSIDKAFETK